MMVMPTYNLEPVVRGEIQVVAPLAPPHSGGRVTLRRGAAEDHILAQTGLGGHRQQGELVLEVWNGKMRLKNIRYSTYRK